MAKKEEKKEPITEEIEIISTMEKEKEEDIEKLNKELDEQKKKAEEYFDSLKRNMAEFDNFKKRIGKEKESLYSTILSGIVIDLLPVIDNFEKALEAECKDKKYKEGVEMIHTQLMDLLKKNGVEPIKDLGQTFDPEFHEAVMSVSDETKGEKEIVEVLKSGYKLNDRVVRHSLVKVAN